MSKSNKKESGRLKDACQRERLRGKERHKVNRLIREGRFEELDEVEEEIPLEEKDR